MRPAALSLIPRPGAGLVVLLSVALALAGVVWAAAQARPAGLHAVTLCSDGGAATVLLDARGNPAPPPLPCPDCLATLALALPPEAPNRAARRRLRRGRPPAGTGPASRPVPQPRARAPPA